MSITVSGLPRPGGPPGGVRRRGGWRGRCRGGLRVVAFAGTAAGSGSGPSAGTSSPAAVTISAKSVPGVGTVLVDGQGMTLYLLSSEKSGKNLHGCQWLHEGMAGNRAGQRGDGSDGGSGVTSSLLGTVKDAAGSPKVTYDGWPVYTFIGDSGPGVAHGKGLTSSGGTWYVLNASGAPVTSSQSQPASSPSAGGGGGYGY